MLKCLKSKAAGAAGALVILFGGAMTLFNPAVAQTDYAAIEANPPLWSISDEDSTVYLFGTVHILPPELDWNTAKVSDAFADSDVIMFEADATSAEAQAQIQQLIPQLAVNAPGVTLSGLISDQAKADVATIAAGLGAPAGALEAQLDPFQPWFASLNLAILQIQAGGYDSNSGVEMILGAEAEAAGKPKAYFETVEQQLRFFADMPMEQQIANFEIGVRDMIENPDVLSELVQAWAVGDMSTIDQLINGAMREQAPELYERLIVTRNRNWIPSIEAALAGSEDVFVAVGAGHMPGEAGVIALLAAEGHTVTRH